MDICVLIGGDDSFEENQSQEQTPNNMIKLLVQPSLLDNTYEGFLEECKLYVNAGASSPNLKLVYTKLEDATSQTDLHDHYSVGLLNRTTGETGQFGLQESVRETAGDFIYSTEHSVDNQRTSFKTLEMYLFRQENGG